MEGSSHLKELLCQLVVLVHVEAMPLGSSVEVMQDLPLFGIRINIILQWNKQVRQRSVSGCHL